REDVRLCFGDQGAAGAPGDLGRIRGFAAGRAPGLRICELGTDVVPGHTQTHAWASSYGAETRELRSQDRALLGSAVAGAARVQAGCRMDLRLPAKVRGIGPHAADERRSARSLLER